jgi:hypothetical protein
MDKIELFLSKTNGSGSGDGDGSGDGSGSGSGSGYGYGYGYGDGLPNKIDNMQVYRIDTVPTIITHVVGNIAKGYIVGEDLSLEPCYVAKHDNYFAHGKTKEQAIADVNAKAFSNLDVDEKINEFLKTFSLDKKYKGHEFYKWHNLLTISCDLGRKAFVRDNNLSLDAEYTVLEFIDICRNAWGKEIIKQLENKIKSKEKGEK